MTSSFEKNRRGPPLIIRQGEDFTLELNRRIGQMGVLVKSGDEGKEVVRKLEILGDLLNNALQKTGMDREEFSELVGVEERKLLFAVSGLLKPDEFISEGFLEKIDKGLKGGFNDQAKKLLGE